MRKFRIRWKKMGGHYHLRVFSAAPPYATWAHLGKLVLDERDWTHRYHLFVSGTEWVEEES